MFNLWVLYCTHIIFYIMATGLIMLILGIIGAVAGIATTGIQAGINNKNTRDTNETNLNIARETNASNVEQAELAYQRSLPTAQIKQLIDAGMSKPAALSALTGGGTYNAPVMQSASMQAPQTDLSGISSAFERLTSIPSNVEQAGLVADQRNALQKDIELKQNQDRRAQEEHEFNIWRQQYDRDTATMLDTASSKVANSLIDSGKTIEDFKDFETMIRDLGLSDDSDIRNLTHVARQQLQEGVQSKFDSERARQQQNNANQSSKDAHTKLLDDLKTSNLSRALTGEQISKLERDVDEADQRIQAYKDATNARLKENAAREAQTDFTRIMATFGIAEHELKNSNFWTKDKDGNYIPSGLGSQKSGISDAWKFVGTFFGADMLQDILRGLVTIAK